MCRGRGGSTGVDNLIPMCSKHHHYVDEGGWKLALDPTTRNRTITVPTGDIWETGPPSARAG